MWLCLASTLQKTWLPGLERIVSRVSLAEVNINATNINATANPASCCAGQRGEFTAAKSLQPVSSLQGSRRLFQMCALAFSAAASERCRGGKPYTCQTCVRNASEERMLLLPIPRCPALFLTRSQTAVAHTGVLTVTLKPRSQCSVPALPPSSCTSLG